MKKILYTVLLLALAFAVSACNFNAPSGSSDNSATTEKKELTIAAPDGAPLVAIYEMLKNCTELDGHKINYRIASGSENIGTIVASGEADIAVIPTNVAAKLYNKGAKIKLATVNIFGVLYMVGLNPIIDINSLKGQIVCCTAFGGTPDVALRMILSENNIEYVESDVAVSGKVAIKYVTDGSEVISSLKASATNGIEFGVLGEPAVTQANKVLSSTVAVDFQAEMDKILGKNSFTQAGVVFGESVYNDAALSEAVIARLAQNKVYLTSDVASIKATLAEKGSALKVDFTADTLTRCNIDSKRAATLKTTITDYFTAISAYDATFIGGKIPTDGFYYSAA